MVIMKLGGMGVDLDMLREIYLFKLKKGELVGYYNEVLDKLLF